MALQNVADQCSTFLNMLARGGMDGTVETTGMRRQRPDDELANDEIHGMVVELEDGAKGMAVDIIPLEHVRVSASGGVIEIRFLFATQYSASELSVGLTLPEGVHSFVTLPSDPRMAHWMSSCMQLLHDRMGPLLADATLDVDYVAAPRSELEVPAD